MTNSFSRIRALSPLFVLSATGLFAVAQTLRWGLASASLGKTRERSSKVASARPTAPRTSKNISPIEDTINLAAYKSGVKRLLSITTQNSMDGPQLRVEAEGDQSHLLGFMHELEASPDLGSCLRLHVTGAAPGQAARVSLLFPVGMFPGKTAPASPVAPDSGRDVFVTLWQQRVRDAGDVALEQAKRLEEQQRREQQLAAEQQMKHAAEEQLASKRRELENAYVLTGIVNNGREPIAFVSQKSAGGAALMLRQDDALGEARVARIDETKGEMQLDYHGKFQLLFHLNAPGGGGTYQ